MTRIWNNYKNIFLAQRVCTPLFTEEEVNELHAMFPSVEVDVIRCILEEKRGNKDSTVTAILEMTADQ